MNPPTIVRFIDRTIKEIVVNLEDFTVVWLDLDLNKTDDCFETLLALREILNYLKECDDPDKSIDYITSIQNEKVFLIMSGSLGEILVPFIENDERYSIFQKIDGLHLQWFHCSFTVEAV
ncbi:unnamed protein product [Didymodactylos carnosus]|uniref:Uncharacterized protein n=1 Tax=Didymodactylos carnosus TaxID=1234261 RepID=A0A815GBX8_9BILA|nr:unnamed protein product [Didymodactylos carnosus]CAF4195781.1 unnamed protein product [Didymodactylos carnosus]